MGMSTTPKRIIPWIAGAALAVSLSACGTPAPNEAPQSPPASVNESLPPEALEPDASVVPIDPQENPGAEQTFDGEGVTEDTITANLMEMKIPAGIKIPEDTLVTKAEPPLIMMADEDPAAVIEAVESSAKEAGYEIYAEVADGKVFVGNGNAVLFTATPMAQTLTWGPEAMKDVLADL